ncbi:hypothetical protein [Xenorhabdus santafensis]|uniref:hypothetical protein n=1 Tax=Xenorhabdus santafensis TaxID=2582833 RepID=UPI0029E7FDD4|nr:hypothetical protein [Xenorhabdus sp. 12]
MARIPWCNNVLFWRLYLPRGYAFGRRIRKLKVYDGKLTAANLQRWLAVNRI